LLSYPRSFLVDYDGSRENNFTTIRIFLAWLVLYGHSYAIQKVPGIKDPLLHLFQGSTWIGEIAVNGFFAISGYLVAASLVKRGITDYAVSRMLRIYPALIVCVLFSVFIIGPLFTNLAISEYFSSPKTMQYLRNAAAFFKMHWYLPGMFEQNTRDQINGSLWTLTVEVRCYLMLAFLGLIGFRLNKLTANTLLAVTFLVGLLSFSSIPLLGENAKWARPALYFLIGASLFVNRDRVLLDYRIALFALILAYLSFGKDWFNFTFPLALTYLIFYAAYATRYLQTDEKLGDISYGIYIYAWPTQQMVAQIFPDQTPYFNTLVSSVIVIAAAYISWHYLEKPILGYKETLLRKKRDWGIISRIKTLVSERSSDNT